MSGKILHSCNSKRFLSRGPAKPHVPVLKANNTEPKMKVVADNIIVKTMVNQSFKSTAIHNMHYLPLIAITDKMKVKLTGVRCRLF